MGMFFFLINTAIVIDSYLFVYAHESHLRRNGLKTDGSAKHSKKRSGQVLTG